MNRVATQADINLYGNYITIGDWIGDTPTTLRADGIHTLRYTNFSTAFPGVRENAILWVDNDKLGSFCEFRLLNGDAQTPWHIQNATLKPIPNTRFDGIYTEYSYGGFLCLVQGLKNFRGEFSSDKYPGLNTIDKSDPFLKGKFGFGITSKGYYSGFHGFSLSVLDGGSLYLEGFEGEHGFSLLRVQGGSYDWNIDMEVDNFYVHDTDSEAFYIGATAAPPHAKIRNLKIGRGIFSRAGSEAIQVQHITGNADISNLTLFASDAGFLNQFQPGQDTAVQIVADEGNNVFQNLVIDGSGSHAINCFGATHPSTNKNTTIKNILINNSRGEAIYFHPSCRHGMNWNFDNVYIRKPNREYYIHNKVTSPNWLISANNGGDKITIGKVIHDGTYTNVYQNTSLITTGELVRQDLPEVQYVNSGFYEPANRVKFYEQFYATYISGFPKSVPAGTDTRTELEKLPKPVDYKAGDILSDREPLFAPVWCKVLTDFTASEVRPKNRPDCKVLTWDSKGVRNDQSTWNKDSVQKPYPPDDLRVVNGSYYANINIGLIQQTDPIAIQLAEAKALIIVLTAQLQIKNDQEAVLMSEIAALKTKIVSLYAELNVTLEKYK